MKVLQHYFSMGEDADYRGTWATSSHNRNAVIAGGAEGQWSALMPESIQLGDMSSPFGSVSTETDRIVVQRLRNQGFCVRDAIDIRIRRIRRIPRIHIIFPLCISRRTLISPQIFTVGNLRRVAPSARCPNTVSRPRREVTGNGEREPAVYVATEIVQRFGGDAIAVCPVLTPLAPRSNPPVRKNAPACFATPAENNIPEWLTRITR